MLEKLKTLTGVPAQEIGDRLEKPFTDPKAYSKIRGGAGGAANLTDIETAWMIERLNEVFGPYGLGWRLEWDPEFVHVQQPSEKNKSWTATIRRAEFHYILLDADGKERICTAPCSGGSSNNELGYALKGMETSAIGNAVSKMRFQEQVYKGKLSHANAAKLLKAHAENGKEGAANKKTASKAKPAAGKPKANTKPKKVEEETFADPSLESYGSYVVPLGKYKGKTLAELLETDVRIVTWFAEDMTATNDVAEELSNQATQFLVEVGPDKLQEIQDLQQEAV